MSMGLLIQYVVIGLVVAASALAAFRKLAPQLTSRWLAAASMRLSRSDSRLMQRLGRRLQPRQATGSCADGCSTCGACGPKPPMAAKGEAVPLRFRPRDR